MAIAERVNFGLFEGAPLGSSVRVAGRLSPSGGAELTLSTTDSGTLVLSGDDLGSLENLENFVEVVGTKAGAASLTVHGALALGGKLDGELWDSALTMMRMSQFMHLFKPVSG